MRGSVGVGRLLMAGVLVWAAAGCSSVVEGAAEPASGQEGLFDPCKDIPDSVLEEVGLDPATEEVDIAGVEQPGWRICSWTQSEYYVIVFSGENSLDDAKANASFTGFETLLIGGRPALRFHSASDPDIDRCYVGLDVSLGSIWIAADAKNSQQQEDSMCSVASRYAEALEGALPR